MPIKEQAMGASDEVPTQTQTREQTQYNSNYIPEAAQNVQIVNIESKSQTQNDYYSTGPDD